MRAAVLEGKEQPLAIKQMPQPEPGEEDVVVKIRAAALNRRDYWITKGRYPGLKFPVILGSDGAGTVDGQEVIINPNQNWGEDPRVQQSGYSILGLPENGTLAEFVKVEKNRLVPKPGHLTMEEAAALPLAGMTAFRALFTKCQAQKNDRVLISGVGGGVALMACQFAIASGLETWVTSSAETKIDRAIQLGAAGGANYTEENWDKNLKEKSGGFDIIIDSAAGDGFSKLIGLCRPAARMAIYGGTAGKINQLTPQPIFWKQLSIFGSTMATDNEFHQMVRFVNENKIKPVVDHIFPLEQVQKAMRLMAESNQFGKIVIRMPE